jgi:hypothetical protein
VSDRFRVGIEYTEGKTQVIYLVADGKYYRFTDAREAGEVGIALISNTRFFLHNEVNDKLPGESQIPKPFK